MQISIERNQPRKRISGNFHRYFLARESIDGDLVDRIVQVPRPRRIVNRSAKPIAHRVHHRIVPVRRMKREQRAKLVQRENQRLIIRNQLLVDNYLPHRMREKNRRMIRSVKNHRKAKKHLLR